MQESYKERKFKKEVVMPGEYEMPYNMDLFLYLRGLRNDLIKRALKITQDKSSLEDTEEIAMRELVFRQMILNGYLSGEEIVRDLEEKTKEKVDRQKVSDIVLEAEEEIESVYKDQLGGVGKREGNGFPGFLDIVLNLQKEHSVLSEKLREYKILALSGDQDSVYKIDIFGTDENADSAPYRKVVIAHALLFGKFDIDKVKLALREEEGMSEEESNSEKTEITIREIEKYCRLDKDIKSIGENIDKMFKEQ